jgi:hypothetical protein
VLSLSACGISCFFCLWDLCGPRAAGADLPLLPVCVTCHDCRRLFEVLAKLARIAQHHFLLGPPALAHSVHAWLLSKLAALLTLFSASASVNEQNQRPSDKDLDAFLSATTGEDNVKA